jgi:hypothetical protein
MSMIQTQPPKVSPWYLAALLAAPLCVPAQATVQITSVTPSAKPPQLMGASITWTVKATDTNAGPLTFQFNVAPPGGSLALVKDFNVGTLKRAASGLLSPSCGCPQVSKAAIKIQVVDQGLHHRGDGLEDRQLHLGSIGDRQHAGGGEDRQSAGGVVQRAILRGRAAACRSAFSHNRWLRRS